MKNLLYILLIFTLSAQAQVESCSYVVIDATDRLRNMQEGIHYSPNCGGGCFLEVVAINGIEFNGEKIKIGDASLEVFGKLTNFGEEITDIEAYVLGLISTTCPNSWFIHHPETLSVTSNGASKIMMFPNPAKNIVNVVGNAIETIKIIDIQGRLLYTEMHPIRYNRLRLNLDAGLYFVKITDSNGNVGTKKLIVK